MSAPRPVSLLHGALLFALTLGLAGPASAGQWAPGVNHRQQHQHWRIAEGLRSGALTADEGRLLYRNQRALRREDRWYRADGHLSRYERYDLHRDLNWASREIYRQTHDGDMRPHH